MKQAMSATVQSKIATPENVSASVLVTPSSWLLRKRVSPKAAARPTHTPIRVSRNPRPSTSRKTSCLLAPSAMRMLPRSVTCDAVNSDGREHEGEQTEGADECSGDALREAGDLLALFESGD